MSHEDQFTATGPSFTGAGFSRAAFSTDTGPDTGTYGVHVQGTFCGVYGDALKNDNSGLSGSHARLAKDGTGIYGTGHTYGVYGSSNRFTLQEQANSNDQKKEPPGFGSPGKGAIGVVGASIDVPGIVGASNISISDSASVRITDLTGQPIGVIGISRESTGVFGLSWGGITSPLPNLNLKNTGVFGFSEGGPGVRGISTTGAGVRGTSTTGRGGVFESSIAQLRLVPHDDKFDPSGGTGTKLPKDGKAGDLLVSRNPEGQASLFFCVHDSIGTTPAQWAPVLLGPQVAGNS